MNWFRGQPFLNFETKLKFIGWKNYFEKGYALTNYLKYAVLAFGLERILKSHLNTAILYGIIYGIACQIVGYIWFKTDLYRAEIEFSNRYNPFVKEVRHKLRNGKI